MGIWKGKSGRLHPASKEVAVYLEDGSTRYYGSVNELARDFGVEQSNCSSYLRGERKTIPPRLRTAGVFEFVYTGRTGTPAIVRKESSISTEVSGPSAL